MNHLTAALALYSILSTLSLAHALRKLRAARIEKVSWQLVAEELWEEPMGDEIVRVE